MTHTREFSRPVAIEGIIANRERIEKIEATKAECAALAKRFDLRSLDYLKAHMTIMRISDGNIVRIQGEIKAEVVQACVVSLQDVPSHIHAQFDTSFSEEGEIFEEEIEMELGEEEDPHEVLENGIIDLGELAAQYLSLELEPYPRAPGVSLAAQMAELGSEAKNRPFDILQNLKGDKDK